MEKISEKNASDLLLQYYGINGFATKLPGEVDLNFHIRDVAGKEYVLKLAAPSTDTDVLDFQHAVIERLSAISTLITPHIISALDNVKIVRVVVDEHAYCMRLFSWIEGRMFASVNPHSPVLLYRLGEMCGKISKGLAGFEHPGARRFLKWDPSQAEWTRTHLARFQNDKKELVDYFYGLYEKAKPIIAATRRGINHNDANDHNVLIIGAGDNVSIAGVIDFGDSVFTNTINELAIAIAYAMMHKPNPLEAAVPIIKGYNDQFAIEENELAVLFSLISARLLISVTCSAINFAENPDNIYLQVSDASAWDLLKKLKSLSPDLAHFTFRSACGLEPCPLNHKFITWVTTALEKATFPIKNEKPEAWLDLSASSPDVGSLQNLLDPDLLDRKVSQMMGDAKADVAVGRYDEARAFYSTDAFASDGNDAPGWRTVHIGIDLFVAAGTEVFATYAGRVFCVKNNNEERDYGPTVILVHGLQSGEVFYTLYGHLKVDTLHFVSEGQSVKKGEMIGWVGTKKENGNWPSHLHFQVILDMLGRKGEFPGVATAQDLDIWKSISPDPWLLFTGNYSPKTDELPTDDIISFRNRHLGKNLSLSYRDPLKIVRGEGAYLLDDKARKYLDTVNNVAHVGHEHPRVVAAGQKQMAVLNTNTRYLHDNIIKFTKELLKTMPPGLDVVYLVNSGSEANELALRLAKNFTGQKDMIVSELGYHGNTNSCVEISAYKFAGPGGEGASQYVHGVPIPDTYRGIYRADDPGAAAKYASHVKDAVTNISGMGRKPAALIFESVISCGGQVELPSGFLKEAYREVRSHGGVCIADEVQTGCGRVGKNFWAFEQHDVVPDIITIGKPIGNGHPLGVVVTTLAIADAFHNGMEYFNTFGGNPVSCAIGLEVLKIINEEKLQQNAMTVGSYLKTGLQNLMDRFEIIGDVRGPGLFIGIELVKSRATKTPASTSAAYLVNRMRDRGILMSIDGPFHNVLKIKPPMVFNRQHSDLLLDTMAKVLEEDMMKPAI